jgi:hypothetical protein
MGPYGVYQESAYATVSVTFPIYVTAAHFNACYAIGTSDNSALKKIFQFVVNSAEQCPRQADLRCIHREHE